MRKIVLTQKIYNINVKQSGCELNVIWSLKLINKVPLQPNAKIQKGDIFQSQMILSTENFPAIPGIGVWDTVIKNKSISLEFPGREIPIKNYNEVLQIWP